MSEMSDFSNKNVHFFAPYLHIFALISRVDFSQPKYVGRLKSTLLLLNVKGVNYKDKKMPFYFSNNSLKAFANAIFALL